MIRALGYSSTPFQPHHPGRLCRGRERWVPGWEVEDGPALTRLVISGARFTDDSARDAQRGLVHSGVHVGELLRAVFGDVPLIAFKEEGELAVVPPYVEDEDLFWAPRSGGRRFDPAQRWRARIDDAEELHRLVIEDIVDGFLVGLEQPELPAELEEALHLLTAHGDDSQYPVARFQPLAIPDALAHAEALVCVHQDKHGPSLGIYTVEPLDRGDAIAEVAERCEALPVPFAIPPMLARWDRALHELRIRWVAEREDEFPVPPSDDATRWGANAERQSEE